MKNKKFAALYYERVSTEHETQDNSMVNQRSLCNNFLKRNQDIRLAEPIDTYVERVSGKSDARPRYQALIKRLKQGDIDYLLIKDFKRLNRSSEVSAQMKNLSKKYGFKFVLLSTGQIYDPNSPENRMMYGFESLLNEEVVYRQSDYARLAHKQKCEEKRLNRNNVTFGYAWNKEDDDIVIDVEESRIIRELFELYVFKGYGTEELRKHLALKHGIHRTANTIRKWLQETAYIGVFHLNKKGSELGVGVGQKTRRFDNPKDEWISVLRPDLAFVDKKVFELAQKIRESRKRTYDSTGKNAPKERFQGKHLFSSILFCNECGSAYVHGYADRKCQIGIYRDSYKFRRHNALEECPNQNYKRVYEEDMKRLVIETFSRLLDSQGKSFDEVANVLECIIKENVGRNDIQKEKRREVQRIQAKLDKTKAAYIDAPDGGLRDALEKDYEALLGDLKIAEQELEQCNNMVNNMELIEKQIRNMRQAVTKLKHIDVNSLNRHTIRSFVNRIIIHDSGTVEVVLNSFGMGEDKGNWQPLHLFAFNMCETYVRKLEKNKRVLNVQVEMCA